MGEYGTARAVSMAVWRRLTKWSMAKVSTAGANSIEGDDGTLGKVLLADHQFENVGGEHIEVAANDLGDASGATNQQPGTSAAEIKAVYLAPGKVTVKNLCAVLVPMASGGLVQSGIGEAQRGLDLNNHQRVRKHRQTLGQHDPRGTVRSVLSQTLQPGLQHALIAETSRSAKWPTVRARARESA